MINKRSVGTKYEEMACNYLVLNGYKILERNFYDHHHEIDIIAAKNGYVCFIEVKYRASTSFGYPHESITYTKRKSIISSAKYYLYSHGYTSSTPVSFDCILFLGDKITHLRNAFQC